MDRLLTAREVFENKLGCKRTKFYGDIRRLPTFPAPVALIPGGQPKWRESDIDRFIASLPPVSK